MVRIRVRASLSHFLILVISFNLLHAFIKAWVVIQQPKQFVSSFDASMVKHS